MKSRVGNIHSPLLVVRARCSVGTLKHTLQASVHRTDLYIFTCCRPRYTVRTFTSSHAAGLGTTYGPSVFRRCRPRYTVRTFSLQTLPASVHRTDLHVFRSFRPRYTVRSFTSSHAAGLGTTYGPSVFRCCRPRYTVRTFSLQTLLASVHRTDLHFFTHCGLSASYVREFK